MTFPLHLSVDRLDERHSTKISGIVAAAVPDVAPALALCAWHHGQVVLDLHAGWIDPSIPAGAVHGDAMFDLASLTKTVTTTAFLRLASDGQVGLDDPVASVLPQFADSGPRAVDGGQEPLSRELLPAPPARAGWMVDPAEVTFRQLLTHSSGLAPWRSVFEACGPVPPPPSEPGVAGTDAADAGRQERLARGIAAVFGYPFVARPGTEHHYSDLGFMTLGWAVASLSGVPLDAVVGGSVSGPLGLGTLTYDPVAAGIGRSRIVPTSIDEPWRGRRCWGEVEDENAAGLGGVAGHAGLFGTARDVARFGQAWLEGDPRLGPSASLFEEATRDQLPDLDVRRGLGWWLHDPDAGIMPELGPRSFGHSGFTGTSLVVDPDRALVVALLTNRVYHGRRHEGAEAVRSAIHAALAEGVA